MFTIYNTLNKKKQEFKPLEEGKVSMYVCGPTVYDVPHIGHVRSAFSFDVIRNYFEYAGNKVTFVRNVTDVDDKIINRAVEELEEEGLDASSNLLKKKVEEVAYRYLDIYHEQLDLFGIKRPTYEPKATDCIKDMISFIEKLIEKGFAYEAAGSVYFSVEEFSSYGKLSKREKEDLLHGVRIDVDENKKHPLDFALWKKSKPFEPSWGSPWGEGRPGWHIECSVMSTRILGDEFDIHGGGLDLVFPHHENEIAQSEAATGKPFARHWMHNGLLTVNGEKMSKSLGNYITIDDFLGKYRDPDLLKIAFLNSHYRSPMDYSDSKMLEVKKAKKRIEIFLGKVRRLEGKCECLPSKEESVTMTAAFEEDFEKAMEDDFNTPLAMSVIFDAVSAGNDCLIGKNLGKDEKTCCEHCLREFILKAAGVLGLSLEGSGKIDKSKNAKIDKMVREREEARKNKDFRKADELRKKLSGMNIVVEDTPEGPVWRKG